MIQSSWTNVMMLTVGHNFVSSNRSNFAASAQNQIRARSKHIGHAELRQRAATTHPESMDASSRADDDASF
jgi:hypothetical protein